MEIIKARTSIKNLTEKVKNFGKYTAIVGYLRNSSFCYIGGDGLKVNTDLVIFYGKIEYIRKATSTFHFNNYDIFIKNESARIEHKLALTQVKGSSTQLTEIYKNNPFCGSFAFYLRKMLFFDSEEEMNLYIEMNFEKVQEGIKTNEKQF